MVRTALRLCIFLLFLINLSNSISLASGGAPAPWDGEHLSADARTLYEAASAVTPPANADVLVLTDEQSFSYDPAGRQTYMHYVVYKILTQKGAEGWDQVRMQNGSPGTTSVRVCGRG